MTIPKRLRRSITVDATSYHYLETFERSERIVIQHDSGRGACLFVFPHAIMKPTHIADAIRFGISKGWSPGKHSEACSLAFDRDSHDSSLLEFIPNDDFRVVTYATKGELPVGSDASRYPDTRKWYQREVRREN